MQRFEPGETFGALRIVRLLGRGAFASVYLAKDEALGRRVALKVLAPSASSREAEHERQRFLAEARLVAQLTDPHIVALYRLHDLGAQGFALEMEYVDGGSLEARLAAERRLEPEEVAHVMRGLLAALARAHGAQVLHRDVKPENVLLTRSGEVKLADFGLGKHIGEASLSSDATPRIKGTPLYMAPEVIMGEPVSPASDLWSAGAVCFRMLAGTTPFDEPSLAALFYAIHAADPAPLPPGVPAPLRTLVERCLVKDPARRAGSAAELLALLGPEPVSPPRAPADAPSEARGPSALAPERPRLVGRRPELEALRRQVAHLDRGRGGVLWLEGDAGIGKTALLEEAQRLAQGLGARVLRLDLQPWSGLQRGLHEALQRALRRDASSTGGGAGPGGSVEPAPGPFQGSAAPAVRALLAEDAAEALPGRAALLWAATAVLGAWARTRPLLVSIEHAEAADAEDQRLLVPLLHHALEGGYLVAATWRTGASAEPGAAPAVPSWLEELARQPGFLRLRLHPLSPAETMELIGAGDDPAGLPVVDRLVGLAEGSPLFAGELLASMLAGGEVQRGPSGLRPGPRWGQAPLPEHLAEVVLRRIASAGEQERTILEAAAVDGLALDGEALAAVTGLPLLTLLRALNRLHRVHGAVTPQQEGFRFRQAVLREALYASLAAPLRRASHRAFAEHLAARAGKPGVDPERLGTHWEQAGEPSLAAAPLLAAAHAAVLRQENTRSIDLSRRAGLDPLALSPAEARAHAELLLLLVHAYVETHHAVEGEAILTALAAGAREASDALLADRVLVERSFLDCHARGAAGVDVAALRAAAGRLPPSKALGRAHYTLGMHARLTGDLALAREHLARAEAVWGGLGLTGQRASALDLLGSVAWRAGRLEEALACYDEAIRCSRSVGRSVDAAITQVNRASVLEALDRTEGIDEAYTEAAQALQRSGDSERAEHVRTLLASRRLARGDLAGAEALGARALETLRRVGRGPTVATCLRTQAETLAARGRLEEARRLLEEARALGGAAADHEIAALTEGLEVCLEALAGREAEACARLERLAGDARLIPRARSSVSALVAPCALLVGSRALLEHAASLASPVAAAPEDAAALVLRAARALLAEGTAPADLQSLATQAAETARRSGALRMRLLARVLQSEAHRRAGAASPAREEWEGALTLARSVEDVWWQAMLLRWGEQRLGDPSARAARRALLAPLAASLPEERRGPLLRAWDAA